MHTIEAAQHEVMRVCVFVCVHSGPTVCLAKLIACFDNNYDHKRPRKMKKEIERNGQGAPLCHRDVVKDKTT